MRPAGSATVLGLVIAVMAVVLAPALAGAQVGVGVGTSRGSGAGPGIPTQAGPPGQAGPPTVVLGRVVDGDTGEPVGGAIVQIGRNRPSASPVTLFVERTPSAARPSAVPEGPSVAIADAQGRFVFREVAAGSHPLTAQLAGYVNAQHGQRVPQGPSRPFAVTGTAPVQDVTLRIWRFGAISGVVRDEVGDPAVGVRLEALRVAYDAGRRELGRGSSTTTDDRGYYRLASLIPGEYLVTIPSSVRSVPVSTAEWYADARLTSNEPSAALLNDFRESGAPTPNGNGLRIGDHVVQLSTATASLAPGLDATGRLTVFRRVYYPATTTAGEASSVRVAPGEERGGVDLALVVDRAFTIEGRLVDPSGSPVANMGVRLLPSDVSLLANDMGHETAMTATGQDGSFALLGVPPGTYDIRVLRVPRPDNVTRITMTAGGTSTMTVSAGVLRPDGPSIPDEPTLWASQPITIGDSDVEGVSLALNPAPVVSGRIEFEGAAIRPGPEQLSRISISLRPVDGQRVLGIRPSPVSEDGTFTTMGYPPGRYFIAASGSGPWRAAQIDVGGVNALDRAMTLTGNAANVVVRMRDQPVGVSGSVQADAGEALDAIVILFPADFRRRTEEGIPPSRMRSAPVGQNGRFTIQGVLPGDYLLAAVRAESGSDLDDPSVLSELARSATSVTLIEGARQSVTVPLSRISGGL